MILLFNYGLISHTSVCTLRTFEEDSFKYNLKIVLRAVLQIDIKESSTGMAL